MYWNRALLKYMKERHLAPFLIVQQMLSLETLCKYLTYLVVIQSQMLWPDSLLGTMPLL